MPELPEVETIVREMRESGLVGQRIEHATIFWERTLSGLPAADFCKRIKHQIILEINRRGKYIVMSLSRDTLIVHLRMTGKFLIENVNSPFTSHERARLDLGDKRALRYEDQRKFGKWILTDRPQEVLGKIGIEPLSNDFTLQAFKNLLKGNRQIKPFLLDQHHVTGLGNIYVDEALWEAKIHPATPIQKLSDHEIVLLHHAIINVLNLGVENTGTSLGSSRANYYSVSGRRGSNQNALKVFRCEGLPCPRCQTIIQKIALAQRGTHYCPNCQKI